MAGAAGASPAHRQGRGGALSGGGAADARADAEARAAPLLPWLASARRKVATASAFLRAHLAAWRQPALRVQAERVLAPSPAAAAAAAFIHPSTPSRQPRPRNAPGELPAAAAAPAAVFSPVNVGPDAPIFCSFPSS